MAWLISVLWPVLAGLGMYGMAGRSRGKNAKNFFRYGAWGFWLLLLRYLAPFLFSPILAPFMWIALLIPSFVLFTMAVNSILKEIRSQQQGEYTDAA